MQMRKTGIQMEIHTKNTRRQLYVIVQKKHSSSRQTMKKSCIIVSMEIPVREAGMSGSQTDR